MKRESVHRMWIGSSGLNILWTLFRPLKCEHDQLLPQNPFLIHNVNSNADVWAWIWSKSVWFGFSTWDNRSTFRCLDLDLSQNRRPIYYLKLPMDHSSSPSNGRWNASVTTNTRVFKTNLLANSFMSLAKLIRTCSENIGPQRATQSFTISSIAVPPSKIQYSDSSLSCLITTAEGGSTKDKMARWRSHC